MAEKRNVLKAGDRVLVVNPGRDRAGQAGKVETLTSDGQVTVQHGDGTRVTYGRREVVR